MRLSGIFIIVLFLTSGCFTESLSNFLATAPPVESDHETAPANTSLPSAQPIPPVETKQEPVAVPAAAPALKQSQPEEGTCIQTKDIVGNLYVRCFENGQWVGK